MTVQAPESAAPQYSPIIGRHIDNTALDAFMTCPRKYHLSMVEHWRREEVSQALGYGGFWHKLMEFHYKSGGHDPEHVITLARPFWRGDVGDDYRTRERAEMEYLNYVARWGTPEDEARNGYGRTVGWPHNPLVEIAVDFHIPGVRHPYVGKIDRIVDINGLLYVEDHKTTSVFGSRYFQQFEMSNQMLGYAFQAARLTGKRIAGVRINVHAIYKRDSKFERADIPFPQDRLDEWASNLDAWLERIEDEHRRHDAGRPAWPANFNACVGKYGPCQYMGICSLTRRIRHSALQQDFKQIPWDPTLVEEGSDVD